MIYSDPIFETDSKAIASLLSTDYTLVTNAFIGLCLYSPNQHFVQEICFELIGNKNVAPNIRDLAVLGLNHTSRNVRTIDIGRLDNILSKMKTEESDIFFGLLGTIHDLLDDLSLNPKYRKEVKKIAHGLKIQI